LPAHAEVALASLAAPPALPRPERLPARAGWLEWFADPPGTALADSLLAFRSLLLVHGAVRVWGLARVGGHPLHVGIALVLTLAAAASLSRRLGRPAVFAGVWAVAVEVAVTHGPANHVYLELVLLAVYALLDPERDGEAVLLACALRWVVALLLFWAGLQKVLYGTYFRAEFLCWMIAQRPAFAAALGFLLPADELARLAAAGAQAVGSGPYRTHAWLLVAASNAVWIAELALPALLLIRRTRVWGAWLAAAFVLSIQLVAREAMFGLLYSQLVLLVLPGRGFRRIAPVYALAYAYLALHLLGLVPADWILKRGSL
jgi:hypothetical protein